MKIILPIVSNAEMNQRRNHDTACKMAVAQRLLESRNGVAFQFGIDGSAANSEKQK